MLDVQTIKMPNNAIILSCQEQHMGFLSIWAVVNPDAPLEDRTFEIIGTGNEVSVVPRNYISTVVCGQLVWHVFEINRNG